VYYPVLARTSNDPSSRQELFLDVFYWLALIAASTSVGMALVGSDAVDLLLGPPWGAAKPLMPWFALAARFHAATSLVYRSFEIMGRPQKSAQLQWIRLLLFVVTLFPTAFLSRSILIVSVARFWLTALFAPVLVYALARAIQISPFVLIRKW